MPAELSVSIHPILPLIFPNEEGFNESIDPDTAWHFYSHSVRRSPKDLKLHTCRVLFAIKNEHSEHISGSLQDLFFVLKGAGETLRIRLLKASIPYLSKEEILYFAMWIKLGINQGIGYKWTPGAVLSDGLFGPDQVLIHSVTTNDNQSLISPLEEARSCMEYGQLEVAKTILEEALETDSENKQLQEELDYLIQYSKSKQIEPAKKEPQSRFSSVLGKMKEKIFH